MRAYALIPARSGSRSLPDKNTLSVAGHPLLAHSIAFAKRIPVERVLLSTDSPRYAEIGRAYGAEVPGLRGAAASGDTAMEEDILAELDTVLPARGIPLPDLWVWLKPTCPFRDAGAVAQAIAVLRDRRGAHRTAGSPALSHPDTGAPATSGAPAPSQGGSRARWRQAATRSAQLDRAIAQGG
jgi:CMP-N-acetylneuraminic acid synthetase